MKNAKDNTVWQALNSILATTRFFPLAKNVSYLSLVCSVSLTNLKKLYTGRTEKEVLGLKNYLQQMKSIWKWCPYGIEINPAKTWHRTWKNSYNYFVVSSTVGQSLIRNGLHGKVAITNPFLRKGNKEKRLRCAKWLKNWTKNQLQKVLWSDEWLDLNIIEAMWDHLRWEWTKRQQKSKEDYIKEMTYCLSSSLKQ